MSCRTGEPSSRSIISALDPPNDNAYARLRPSGLSRGSVRSGDTMHRSTAIDMAADCNAVAHRVNSLDTVAVALRRSTNRVEEEVPDVEVQSDKPHRHRRAPVRPRQRHRLTTRHRVQVVRPPLLAVPSSHGRAAGVFPPNPTMSVPNPRSIPMLSSHPYIAQQLIRDRQERLRQISQRSHLRHEIRRIRRHPNIRI